MAILGDKSSRVHAIAERLRAQIFEGRYLPGTYVRELELAKKFRVSQATIRAALQHLEYVGLVTRTPNIGSVVTRLSPKEVEQRVALRATLEVMAAQSAAPRMDTKEFTELERRLAVLETAVASNQYYEAAQADLGFHRFVWQCSGNNTLCQLLELLTVPLFAFVSILRSHKLQRLPKVVEAHESLIAALWSRDEEKIREAFEKGATSAYRDFVSDGDPAVLASAYGFLEPEPRPWPSAKS